MARPLRRLILLSLGSLVTLLLLAGIAAAVVVLFVDADTFRPRIERMAQEALGREVRLGRLQWDIGWRLGLASSGGSVAGVPSLGEAPLASWRRISLGLALRPLLQRQVLIDTVRVEGLALDLRRDADGAGNWTFDLPADTADTQSGTRIAVQGVHLEDARVSFEDAATDAHWRIEALAADVQLETDAAGAVNAVSDVSLSGNVFGGPLPQQGVPVAFAAPRVDFDPETLRLQLPAFKARFDSVDTEGSIDLAGASAAKAQLALSMPSLRSQLAALGVEAPATRDAAVFGALRVGTQIDYDGETLALSQLQAKLDDTSLQGELRLALEPAGAIRFNLLADRADLDRYLTPADVESDPLELPVAQLEALNAQGELRIAEARIGGAVARNVVINVE